MVCLRLWKNFSKCCYLFRKNYFKFLEPNRLRRRTIVFSRLSIFIWNSKHYYRVSNMCKLCILLSKRLSGFIPIDLKKIQKVGWLMIV